MRASGWLNDYQAVTERYCTFVPPGSKQGLARQTGVPPRWRRRGRRHPTISTRALP